MWQLGYYFHSKSVRSQKYLIQTINMERKKQSKTEKSMIRVTHLKERGKKGPHNVCSILQTNFLFELLLHLLCWCVPIAFLCSDWLEATSWVICFQFYQQIKWQNCTDCLIFKLLVPHQTYFSSVCDFTLKLVKGFSYDSSINNIPWWPNVAKGLNMFLFSGLHLSWFLNGL